MQLPLHFSSVTKLVVLPSFLHDERRNVYGERERERERERLYGQGNQRIRGDLSVVNFTSDNLRQILTEYYFKLCNKMIFIAILAEEVVMA